MPRLIVHGFTISLDGYGAGAHRSLEAPLDRWGPGKVRLRFIDVP